MLDDTDRSEPRPTPTVLLDLDRTLVDVESQVDYCAALDALHRAGASRPPALGPATSWGTCTREVVDLLVGATDRGHWQQMESLVVPYELEGAARAEAMPGLDQLRATLTDHRVAVVTLLSDAATRVTLERHGLAPDVVVARSFEIPAKPHPDQVVAALDALGVAPTETVMLGDSERDEAAAIGAGVPFVGITNGRTEHRFAGSTVVRDLYDAATLLAERTGSR